MATSPYIQRIVSEAGVSERDALVIETAMRYDGYTGGTLDHLSGSEFDATVAKVLSDWQASPRRRMEVERLAATEGTITMDAPEVGTRYRLRYPVERFPHFTAEAGLEGEVTISDEDLIALRMDRPIAGCEEWDNEICWTVDDCFEDEQPYVADFLAHCEVIA